MGHLDTHTYRYVCCSLFFDFLPTCDIVSVRLCVCSELVGRSGDRGRKRELEIKGPEVDVTDENGVLDRIPSPFLLPCRRIDPHYQMTLLSGESERERLVIRTFLVESHSVFECFVASRVSFSSFFRFSFLFFCSSESPRCEFTL